MIMIDWTPEKLKSFEKACRKAEKEGDSFFDWKGMEFALGYAKYLIEYLGERFPKTKSATPQHIKKGKQQ